LATEQPTLPSLAQRWGVEAATLQRWLDEQRRVRVLVSVPVFGPQIVAQLAPVCGGIARRIAGWLRDDALLEPLVEQCSFAHCARPESLCMLWHNSYYEATDRLIARGVLPAFPTSAEGEWGVWLTSHPYGLNPATMDAVG
jgi:hypothetical protein